MYFLKSFARYIKIHIVGDTYFLTIILMVRFPSVRSWGMTLLLSLSCLFICSVSAAGTIPRDGLRLELLLATGAQDTSGNNRLVTSTGIAPSYQVDSVYGMPHARFAGSGWLRINTTWSAGVSDDFAISMWIKIPDSNLVNNQSNNLINLNWWYYNAYGQGINQAYFDKPMVLFSTKSSWNDASNLRFAISKEGKCSINTAWGNLYWQNFHYWTSYNTDIFWLMSPTFDCANLKDGKWHHIVLNRKATTLTTYIDGNSVWSAVSNVQLSRTLNIWSFGFYINTGSYQLYPENTVNQIYASHFLQGWIAWFRMYSRFISESDIEALGDEFRYTQSDLAWIGNITLTMDKYQKPTLSIQTKNIPLNLSKDSVVYEYSVDAKTFSPVQLIEDISSNTWSLSYKISTDMSNVPDGKITVTYRIRSWSEFQNIGTVTFTKLDSVMTITINQPNSDISQSKTITATTDSWAKLYMSQTKMTTCDGSITTWEDYSDLTFTSKNDNGTRICYKAVSSINTKIVYKLSTAIQWIQTMDEQKSTSSLLFSNYLLWNKSNYQKPEDSTFLVLDLLWVTAGQSQWTINGITMTDINGDGLVDFLYSRNDPIRRAILVNNGNYTFRVTYKCAVDSTWLYWWPNANWVWWLNQPTSTYYWDCADPTR